MEEYINIDVNQGTDFSYITIASLNDEAINLYSYNVYAQFSQSPYSETVYTFDSTVSDYANGEITLSLPSDYSSNIRPGRYLYDILIETSNTVSKVQSGIVDIIPTITSIDRG